MRNTGEANIYVLDLETGEESELTLGPAAESNPAWSPDGSLIAFNVDTDQDGFADIYVMNADGSGVRQLSDGKGDERNPVWSPDGTHLLFVARPPVDLANIRNEVFQLHVELVALADGAVSDIQVVSEQPAGPSVSW